MIQKAMHMLCLNLETVWHLLILLSPRLLNTEKGELIIYALSTALAFISIQITFPQCTVYCTSATSQSCDTHHAVLHSSLKQKYCSPSQIHWLQLILLFSVLLCHWKTLPADVSHCSEGKGLCPLNCSKCLMWNRWRKCGVFINSKQQQLKQINTVNGGRWENRGASQEHVIRFKVIFKICL